MLSQSLRRPIMDLLCCDEGYIVRKIRDNYTKKSGGGLSSIIDTLKRQNDRTQHEEAAGDKFGENTADPLEATSSLQAAAAKLVRKRRLDRSNNGPSDFGVQNNNNNLNNNNNVPVKNERLSPNTDASSRSVTPSSYPSDTPPSTSDPPSHPAISGRNYSDFMRSLAAKYNHTNPNDYFSAAVRNGFPPPLDPRFKAHFSNLLPTPLMPKDESPLLNLKKTASDFAAVLNPFSGSASFPPLIDMTATQALLTMVRAAKESEMQTLLKKRITQDTNSSSPLDLSSGGPPPLKRPRLKSSSAVLVRSPNGTLPQKRAESESPRLHEDVSHWNVDDVCNFISGIDICAEYAQNFREQRIDGSGLPMLTEEHLTTTMNMKLGPALKLRSILAKKLGSCSVCLHCTHCHNSAASPEHGNTTGNTSDSGGAS